MKEKCEDRIEGPERIHAGHVQDRAVSPRAGAKRGWRNANEHPLNAAFERGQLRGDARRYSAMQRLQAGEHYRALWEMAVRSGRDSTHIEKVSSGGGEAAGFTASRLDAMRSRAAIDAKLKRADQLIVQRVCAEGHFPSEAVREACGDGYAKATVPRFCEALDALVEAMEKIR